MSEMERQQLDVEKDVYEPIETINDATDFEGIRHVLLLTMSILNTRIVLRESSNKYNDQESVSGYGQLEPVPKMLINQQKTPLLIIIMASKESRDIVDFTIFKDNQEKKFRGSAVDFFKKQISEYRTDAYPSGCDVRFKVIPFDDTTVAAKEAVAIIRKLDQPFLYQDMHGGQREEQMVVDAIVNMLRIENIKVKEAYSIAGIGKDIKNVSKTLGMFDFVAGMDAFINYGYGKTLQNYVSLDSENNWRRQLVHDIAEVAEALSLCQVNEFEKGLDKLKKTIDAEHASDALFDIFKENIKNDYGSLLDSSRTLYDEVNWAFRKGFYQQCLAIIEATTPKYVFNELFSSQPADVISQGESGEKTTLKSRIASLLSLKESREKDINFYLKIMFYPFKNKKSPEYKDASREVMFQTSPKRGCQIDVVFQRVSNFDYSLFEQFGDVWWKLKKCRNRMFHVDVDDEPVTMEELDPLIRKYLDTLKALMASKKDILAHLESVGTLFDGNVVTHKKSEQSKLDENMETQKKTEAFQAKVVQRTKNSLWIRVTDDSAKHFKALPEHNNAHGRIPKYKGYLQENATLKVRYLETDDQGAKFEII